MSDTSRNIRGLLAVAALAAGVSWVVTAPVSASVTPCHARDASRTPTSVTAVCDRTRPGHVAGGAVGRTVGRAAPATADRLARLAGLPGLSRASAVVGFADTTGVAAGTGTPVPPPPAAPATPGRDLGLG
ncbi:hypothetical protein FHR32_003234 [Streptosporangium album]|uniref:Uncharacterized protein n=1 Tax=Streptosporangium album TaxID=47479 RepID=A0A7W7RVD2_9ACTN|nr:hypothetical protein [Streptosporangium album]MBB4938929.1 hypothetical protein [Streptosporangium album]